MLIDAGITGAKRRGDAPLRDRPVAEPDPALDRVVALAADLFDAPVAFLAIRDRDRARVVAHVGLDDETVRRGFPATGLLDAAEPVALSDLRVDPSYPDHPLATAPPHAGFYAGAPLPGGDGMRPGVLCVVDPAPRPMPSPRQVERLAALAALARDMLDRRGAVEVAEAAASVKAELLADVSHELRTPLNGILGFTEILRRDGGLDEDALRSVERIEEAGRGLLGIVGEALDLSKLGSGPVRLDIRPFSVARLVEDTVAMVRPDAEAKGLTLVAEGLDAPLAPLLGDPDRLRQVLLNLLANAIKFTDAGTVRATLAVEPLRSPDDPVRLAIAVQDSGVGIARDGIPRLFRRFVQADAGVERRFGGTGLGLAISKTLVDAMGGAIAVESSPGAGARFTLTLALARASEPPRRPARSPRPVASDALRGLAILVAEDAPLNQKLALQMLEPLGAEVDVVEDGVAAVAAVARRDYALVLMDMEMPVLNGLDATRRIRALPGLAASVPIVALTANVFPEQIALCRAAGMDDHLTKPFGSDDLSAKALRWARRLAPELG